MGKEHGNEASPVLIRNRGLMKLVKVFRNMKQTCIDITPCSTWWAVTFFPLSHQLFDWATHQGAPKDRTITFYHLADRWEPATHEGPDCITLSFLFQCCREAEASVPSLCGSHCEEHCSVTRKQQWRRERLAPCTWTHFPECVWNPLGSPELTHRTRGQWDRLDPLLD